MKIVTIVGARPQFIKAAAVSRVIRDEYSGQLHEVLVHTGQHHDHNMSQVFFDELDIPKPNINLEISGGSHGQMTGRMLESIERVLLAEKPDWVLIYGDTNSTLAGALAAAKLHIPVAHVEAGLRSFNMRMPEEVNRILADRVSRLLLCPTTTAVGNLAHEGIVAGVHNVGDVMYDASLFYRERAAGQSKILQTLNVEPGRYVLATCHRAENTDNPERLLGIVTGLAKVAESMPVILPLHPRTRKLLVDSGRLDLLGHVQTVAPLPFLDMIRLEQSAHAIVTDSGGVQKEAYFFAVPCITVRDETEWVETVEAGWNRLITPSCEAIAASVLSVQPGLAQTQLYGDGNSARTLVSLLRSFVG